MKKRTSQPKPTTRELLVKLAERNLTDTEIGFAVGGQARTVTRWRTGGSQPANKKLVDDVLERLLRHYERNQNDEVQEA